MNKVAEVTLTSNAPGARLFMLGNEAIARGAMEAGVQVVAAYPGTPSSEITETLVSRAAETGMYAEWSINEKVAFEVALAASVAGLRSVSIMKHVGLNVAHDPLMSASYMGAKGGFVVIVADDPGMWSSQNEQDNRYVARQAYVPVLEPSSAQEAKDMMADAFRLSEKYGQMFMLRSVTRIGHARSDVTLGEMTGEKRQGKFEKDPTRFICLPANFRINRKLVVQRINKIKEDADTMPYNQMTIRKGAKLGIIACGISYTYALEAARWLGVEDRVSFLKIGTPYPMPEKLTKQFLKEVPEILVVEELEPFVEDEVKVLAEESGIVKKIHGKDMIPLIGELSVRLVTEALSKLTGVKPPVDFAQLDKVRQETESLLPLRPPTMCAGCPHRGSFYAIGLAAQQYKKETGKEAVRTGDIGCYSLGANPPLLSNDIAVCMGGSFGLANGFAHVLDVPVISHLGDSTFFHSGISPMINAVFNKSKMVMVVMDNSTTAMTGFQPHPGAPVSGPALKIEDIARASGVKFVEVVDAFDLEKVTEVMGRALRFDGPAVVITRGLCNIIAQREKKKQGAKTVLYKVDQEKCKVCKLCINRLGCPALITEGDKVVIDPTQCMGCGICAQICKFDAIIPGA